jgi:hypothetical protein
MVRKKATEIGPNASAVFTETHIDETLRAISPPPGKPQPIQLSTDKNLMTLSARTVLGNAESWAQSVGARDIGVRHLVAAYVLNPPVAHGDQMRRWDFQESKWRPAFFEWVTPRYTAEQWIDVTSRVARTKAVPTFEQPQVKGEALAFPGDQNTLDVLEKAAAFHARRTGADVDATGPEKWLRFQTIFYALVETARTKNDVREAIQPVWSAVKAVDEQYRRARDKFFPSPETSTYAPFSKLDISPRVLNMLQTARELAAAAHRDANGAFSVGALHLAGAIISRRVDGEGDLSALGLVPQQLRNNLIDYARQKGESSDIWREALGEQEVLGAGRPVDLNSDEPEAVVRLDENWTSDPLSIRRDVETFAALLASKNLEPPLSIGLFGAWGSGKTTFLKRLRRAVTHRAEKAKKASDASQPTAFVGNIVHVDFNAWHFAESALTSSLVDTILRELSAYIKDDKTVAGKAWKEQKQAALETTKRKLAAAYSPRLTAAWYWRQARINRHDQPAPLSSCVGSTWPPVYSLIRRQGHGPDDAQDLTQEFFARLLEKNYVQSADAGTLLKRDSVSPKHS